MPNRYTVTAGELAQAREALEEAARALRSSAHHHPGRQASGAAERARMAAARLEAVQIVADLRRPGA